MRMAESRAVGTQFFYVRKLNIVNSLVLWLPDGYMKSFYDVIHYPKRRILTVVH